MAKPSNRSRIEQLTDEWEPVIRAAFFEAVLDITSKAELGQIVARLERGDIAGAIEAVHLDPAAFLALDSAISQTFNAGGASAIGALPKLRDPRGGQFIIRWDVRNPRAEAWLRDHSSSLITRITQEQVSLVRGALVNGLEQGLNPRATALDIIGRVNGAKGKRTGGLVGLSQPQSAAVTKARSALLSGDATAMRGYLTLTRRDRRFDSLVLKAIESGKALDRDAALKIAGRYSDRLLQLRGETIARTETIASLNRSNVEAMQQAVDGGAVKAEHVTKIWHTAQDPRVRDSHAAIDGESVGMNGTFSNGLAYPGDPAGGPEETANCRCWMETRIDFAASILGLAA